MDNTKEANLFITINHEQKSVPKSVLLTLQADLKWGSTNPKERLTAIASTLIKKMNSDSSSQLFQRCSIDGVTAQSNQNLTIPELVSGLVRSKLLGEQVDKQLLPGLISTKGDDDALVAKAQKILNAYFSEIYDASPERWRAASESQVSTNVSIAGHFLLLNELLEYLKNKKNINVRSLSEKEIIDNLKPLLEPVLSFIQKASNADLKERFKVMYGGGGPKQYFHNLSELIYKKFSDFGSDELKDFLKAKNDNRKDITNTNVIKICEQLTDFVIDGLKKIHTDGASSSGESLFWEEGIQSQGAKKKAFERQLEAKPPKRTKEYYLDLLDFKAIIEQKNNWDYFEPFLSIPLEDEGVKGNKKFYTAWVAMLNDVRKIAAHPSGNRNYNEDDYRFVSWLKEELDSRLSSKA
jgi:hypothetical protein